MATIYSRASRVLVWLGEGVGELEASQHESKIRFILNCFIPGNKDFGGIPHYTDPAWRTILSLFQTRWFERLWVFQEVVQAQQVDFLYIKYLISWHAILKLQSLPWHVSDDASKKAAPKVREGQQSMNSLRFMRANFQYHGYLDFLHLSGFLLRFKKVERKVDRVYAIYSLLDEETQHSIQIDYSHSNQEHYWNLYVQLTKRSFEICGSHTLQYAESVERPIQLPSWCPNWNCPSRVRPMMSGKMFRAGGVFDRNATRCRVETSPNSSQIGVHGFRIDRVRRVLPLGVAIPHWDFVMRNVDSELAATWLAQEEKCSQLAFSSTTDTTYATHAHLRNLTWNSITDGTLITESDWPRVTKAYQALLTLFKDSVNKCVPKTYDWSADIYPIMAKLHDKAVTELFARPYFITENNRLGRGVPSMENGDEICVLYSATAPILLRRPNKSVDTWKVIGDVYLDMCMHLEEMPDQGRGEDNVFILV